MQNIFKHDRVYDFNPIFHLNDLTVHADLRDSLWKSQAKINFSFEDTSETISERVGTQFLLNIQKPTNSPGVATFKTWLQTRNNG